MTLTIFQRRNPELLAQYQRSGHPRDRNKIVEFNLPLVRQVANRLRPHTAVPFDDLVQQGSIGLIRAVEAFDPAQGTSLSSFAVPFIRGAMQHHLRDNEQPLKASRLLRDLHQRGQTLQQQRLHQQKPALRDAELAAALGCPVAQWQEACSLHWALQCSSLDAPVGTAEASSTPLVEKLSAREAPHPCRADRLSESSCSEPEPQHWLRQRLQDLEVSERRLLEGRVLDGASWRQLGKELGIRARVAQRRFERLAARLRQELSREWGDLFAQA